MGNIRCRRIVLAVLTVAALLTGSAPAALAGHSGGGSELLELLPVLRHRATDPARRLGVLLVNPGRRYWPGTT